MSGQQITLTRLWATSFAALFGTIAISAVGQAQTSSPIPPKPTSEQLTFFEKKVRPILVAQCIACHGPALQSGGVRLDNAADARKSLIPGDPEHSRLIHAVQYKGEIKMPPDGKRPQTEIDTLTEWVKMGAPWPTDPTSAVPRKGSAPSANQKSGPPANWWSFQPVRRPAMPKVHNTAWAKSTVDAFILAELESKNLAPAPVAGKRALIRRAYFDLLGLPPTPAQVEAFVQDRSPQAFAKVVDGLLASPHYGERWARHWLDLVRYADSNGLDENKAFAYAWRYRDWVVNALNQDKPYDLFLQEQIAGDLMDSNGDEDLRNARLTATGFLTLGAKVLAEQDKPKMVMDIVDEQIEVLSKATMGLTISCARCHDHKFDPISTRDYYALAGIFKSTKTMKNLGFVSEWNERTLPTPTLLAARKKYTDEIIAPAQETLDRTKKVANDTVAATIRQNAQTYLKSAIDYAKQPGVLVSQAENPPYPGAPFRVQLEATAFVRGNAVRDRDNYGKGIGVLITDSAPVSAEWDIELPEAGRYQLELRYAAQESRPIRILVNGKVVNENAASQITGSWMPDGQHWEAQGIYTFARGKNTVRLERNDGPIPHIHRLLLLASPVVPSPANGVKPLSLADIAKRDGVAPEIVGRLAGRIFGAPDPLSLLPTLLTEDMLWLPQKPEDLYAATDKDAVKKAQEILDAARKGMPEIPTVMAVEDEMKPEDVRVHLRGNTLTLGEIAPRGFPVALVKSCPTDARTAVDAQSSGRLALARWLTRPQHPLTARVEVNRVWQHLFGVGIVPTPDNWGVKGEKPTNPRLLDYLASTFVSEDNWSQKKLIRRLMLSSTYQMATTSPLAARASGVDPENRLLWRMNRRRLEAEPLRDSLLAVSGTLDSAMGGTLLSTPDNDYVTNDQSADQAHYNAPRRSIYLPVIRNSIYGLFQAFDFGDGSTVTAQRASTTVAPQALFLLNSPLVRDASLAFARTLLTGATAPPTVEARIRQAYYRAIGRPATAVELTRAQVFLDRYDRALTTVEPNTEKRQLRVYQSLCQVLFASNEFSYVE